MKFYAIKERVARSGVVASAVVALAIGASTACAQSQGQNVPQQRQERGEGRGQFDPQQRIDRRIASMTQDLQLSADQQARIRTILTNESTQMQALRQKNGFQGPPRGGERPDGQRSDSTRADRGGRGGGGFGGQRQLPPEVKALRDQTDKQIDAVLNSTQRAKYQQLRQQREQEHQKHEGDRAGQRAS
jgi:hypothetical protein